MKILKDKCCVVAKELGDQISQMDLILCVSSPDLEALAEDFCKVLDEYAARSGKIFKPDDRIDFATSVIKVCEERGALTCYELELKNDQFVPGVTKTLLQWRDQRYVCAANHSEHTPAKLIDRLVASPDVFDQTATTIEGVRYPFDAPNSGWWLFGSGFAGDMASMKNVHVGHVVQAYPEIVECLGLEPGFCFKSGGDRRVWFDQEAAMRNPV
jgi:hypothetical protein